MKQVYLVRASEWETEVDCVCTTRELALRECKRLADKYEFEDYDYDECEPYIEIVEMDLIEE